MELSSPWVLGVGRVRTVNETGDGGRSGGLCKTNLLPFLIDKGF